jgi:hypothetical protein
LRIGNDFFYSAFNFEDEVALDGFPDYTSVASFHFQYLKTSHMLQVGLLRKKRLYVAGGFSTGFAIAADANATITYETGTRSIQKLEPKKFDLGYVAGIGFQAGKFNAQVRYEFSALGITEGENSDLSRAYLLLTYRLSR